MQEITLTSTQYILLGAAFGALFGLLFAMIPFFLGKKFGNAQYGKIAFLSGLIGGALLGWPGAILSSVVFSVLIIANRKSNQA